MRVTVFTLEFPGATEAFIVRQVQGLAAEVCTLRRIAEPPLPDLAVTELPGFREPGALGKLASRGWNLLRHRNSSKLPASIEAAWEAHLAARRPDVVLAQYGDNALRAIDACVRQRVPLVIHFHGYDIAPGRKLRWPDYRFSLRRALAKAAACIVVNPFQARTLERLGAARDRISIIPCGVPLDELRPSSRVAEDPCRFLFVGRMARGKSPFETIRAFEACARRCDGVTLTMIGPGPLLGEAQRLAAELGVGEKIQFMGWQPAVVVREQLQNAGAFVLAPKAERKGFVEGWPVAIAEAAASALPVVASRHGVVPTQVIDGRTGYLVAEGDWRAMAEHMVRLANDPALRRSMGEAGREHIAKVGSFEDCLARLRGVLASVALVKR